MHPYLQATLGGILIGLASWALFAGLGRVLGISGIASEALVDRSRSSVWRWAFLLGLIGGGALFSVWMDTPVSAARPGWLVMVAGLLVGFGTVLGSGCTSGHGVCGLGRRSLRSLVAVCTFMATGFATVFIATHAMN